MRKFNPNYSLVRVLHAVPNGEVVDVYINDTLFFSDLVFRQFSPYIYVPEGSYQISVYPANTRENPLVSRNIDVEKDKLITIAIAGNAGTLRLLDIEEEFETPSKGKSETRVVNLVPNSPDINIIYNDSALFESIDFRDVTDYKEILPGIYRIDLELVENGKIVRTTRVNINPDRIYTLYLLGNAANIEIFQSLDGASFIRYKI